MDAWGSSPFSVLVIVRKPVRGRPNKSGGQSANTIKTHDQKGKGPEVLNLRGKQLK